MNIEAGDILINGRVEAYSQKQVSDEKKQGKELEQLYKEMSDEGYEANPSSLPNSFNSHSGPIGPLQDVSTRKLLINLIQTMNASYPDYDFSSIKPEQFSREDLFMVMNSINNRLSDLPEVRSGTFLQQFWTAVEELVKLEECEVFSYIPDLEGDPFSENSLWSCNFFFVNRHLKRLVYFSCIAKSKYHIFQPVSSDYDSDAEEMRPYNEEEEMEVDQFWDDEMY